MSCGPRRYSDWKAPADDGKLLIWPEPDELLRETLENHARLHREEARIARVPLREVRARLRQFIGHDDAAPLLASGHQTELYHPGVWVKDALLNAAAARINGQAYHVAVDTDAPKHLNLHWPGGSVPLTDDPNLTSASWSGQLDAPSPAHLQSILDQFEESAREWSFRPMLPELLLSLRRLALESSTLSSALTNAQHQLDWDLGLRHHVLLASPLFETDAFALFVHHVLSNARRFAIDYNESLQAYRDDHGMNTRSRPMPDLFVSDQSVEMPFWLDDLESGTRARPSVFPIDDGFMLQLNCGEGFTFDPKQEGWDAAAKLKQWLSTSRHRLAPRALTLTAFLRLCLVDQFVHGVGGGRYDQVTDRLIERHFRIDPPKFSVTTATLYFPDAVGRQRVCVPCVRHEGHRLRHGVLGERKREYVQTIDSLPWRSPQRQVVFLEMHSALDAAARTSPLVQRWQAKLLETQDREREEQALFDRELFYAIQPRERLERMIQEYQRVFHE
jgi:hypothetical protein